MGQGMLSHAKYYDVITDDVLLKNAKTLLKVKSFHHENIYLSAAHNSECKDIHVYRYDFKSPSLQEIII